MLFLGRNRKRQFYKTMVEALGTYRTYLLGKPSCFITSVSSMEKERKEQEEKRNNQNKRASFMRGRSFYTQNQTEGRGRT